MPDFSVSDRVHMARALQLAERGIYTAHPNPMVGCVIVRDGVVVGEGWHKFAGEPHAEINALTQAGAKVRGATAYVTLEPCSHQGKTPPCVQALVAAGVSEVVVALQDPNPKVNGQGLDALRQAGVRTRVGLMGAEVAQLLSGFISRMTRGRPFVRLKIACSIDGGIAMLDGQSQWITGPEAREDVQRLRARSGAIMTGIGTVLADDPSLTVRDTAIDTAGRQPIRAVLDNGLRMPLSAEMLALPGETLIYCSDEVARVPLIEAGAEVVRVDVVNGMLSAAAVLNDLASREVNDVLVETGPTLAGNLLSCGLVDELVIYQAPHIMGSETMRMFNTPTWTELADRKLLTVTDVHQVGNDTRITARISG